MESLHARPTAYLVQVKSVRTGQWYDLPSPLLPLEDAKRLREGVAAEGMETRLVRVAHEIVED